MPHPNSIMYNVYIFPFWPMKAYWFMAKSVQLITLRDFPTPAADHPDA